MLQRRLRRFPSSGSSTALPAASARNDRDHRSYWTDRANGPRRTDGTYGSSRSDWRNRCCRTNWSNRLDRRNRADWACWSNRSYWCYWRHRSNGTCRTDWCYWRYRGYRPCRNHHCRACCRGYSDQQRHRHRDHDFQSASRISASGWCDRRIVTSLKVSLRKVAHSRHHSNHPLRHDFPLCCRSDPRQKQPRPFASSPAALSRSIPAPASPRSSPHDSFS